MDPTLNDWANDGNMTLQSASARLGYKTDGSDRSACRWQRRDLVAASSGTPSGETGSSWT